MSENVFRWNQNLLCSYHWDRGHITEDCRILKDHLGRLEKEGYIKEFIVRDNPRPQYVKKASTSRTLASSRGLIEVIHVAKQLVKPRQITSRVMVVALVSDPEMDSPPLKGDDGRGHWFY